MTENNARLAKIFQQMADVIELLGGNRFRVNAFQNASRSLRELTRDVSELDRKELTELHGIGSGTADRIREYLSSGQITEHQELLAEVPEGLLPLLEISGLGPKTVATLWQQGGVTDVESLEAKLNTGELESLPRMGKKKLEKIQQSLSFARQAGERVRIGEAMPLAAWFVDQLRQMKEVREAAYAGSLRRGRETVGDLDLLVSSDPDAGEKIANRFVKLEPVTEVLLKGRTKTSVRTQRGVQVDLRVVEAAAFGAALLYFTGSKQHNVELRERAIAQKQKLSEYGLFDAETDERVAGASEQEVYDALGLGWIPPELREARGEIDQAAKGELPRLLEFGDIRCELHAHTTASDGMLSIRELAAMAIDRGFHTIAVTDHSRGQVQANGLSIERLERHVERVREVAAELKGKIRVLAGTEVDILADGKLDYPDSLLRELDIVVASPHAALTQEPAKATARLVKAIENRYVTIIGHPTGRIVGRRPGLSPDMGKVIEAAAERGVALEINANYHRL
ncbi:MAG: DNA polymerase/3'-5' exonuclease PolX, partial [Phycisphaeraceae bacterium]